MDKRWWLFLLVVALFLLTRLFRGKKLNLNVVSESLDDPLQQNSDLGPYKHITFNGKVVRFMNDKINIFYFLSVFPEKEIRTETIIFTVVGYTGGYLITFRNDEVIEWTQNGVRLPLGVLNPIKVNQAHKVLEAVRVVQGK